MLVNTMKILLAIATRANKGVGTNAGGLLKAAEQRAILRHVSCTLEQKSILFAAWKRRSHMHAYPGNIG